MKELTKAEEEIMQALWKIDKGFIKDILEQFPDPKPAYTTVSTLVRILETKDFIGHKAYGKTFEYFPLVSKDSYKQHFLKKHVNNYFGGSFKSLLSFFVKNEEVSLEEIDMLMQQLKEDDSKKDQDK